jgi:hypothetical protein
MKSDATTEISKVGIATGYGLYDREIEVRVW